MEKTRRKSRLNPEKCGGAHTFLRKSMTGVILNRASFLKPDDNNEVPSTASNGPVEEHEDSSLISSLKMNDDDIYDNIKSSPSISLKSEHFNFESVKLTFPSANNEKDRPSLKENITDFIIEPLIKTDDSHEGSSKNVMMEPGEIPCKRNSLCKLLDSDRKNSINKELVNVILSNEEVFKTIDRKITKSLSNSKSKLLESTKSDIEKVQSVVEDPIEASTLINLQDVIEAKIEELIETPKSEPSDLILNSVEDNLFPSKSRHSSQDHIISEKRVSFKNDPNVSTNINKENITRKSSIEKIQEIIGDKLAALKSLNDKIPINCIKELEEKNESSIKTLKSVPMELVLDYVQNKLSLSINNQSSKNHCFPERRVSLPYQIMEQLNTFKDDPNLSTIIDKCSIEKIQEIIGDELATLKSLSYKKPTNCINELEEKNERSIETLKSVPMEQVLDYVQNKLSPSKNNQSSRNRCFPERKVSFPHEIMKQSNTSKADPCENVFEGQHLQREISPICPTISITINKDCCGCMNKLSTKKKSISLENCRCDSYKRWGNIKNSTNYDYDRLEKPFNKIDKDFTKKSDDDEDTEQLLNLCEKYLQKKRFISSHQQQSLQHGNGNELLLCDQEYTDSQIPLISSKRPKVIHCSSYIMNYNKTQFDTNTIESINPIFSPYRINRRIPTIPAYNGQVSKVYFTSSIENPLQIQMSHCKNQAQNHPSRIISLTTSIVNPYKVSDNLCVSNEISTENSKLKCRKKGKMICTSCCSSRSDYPSKSLKKKCNTQVLKCNLPCHKSLNPCKRLKDNNRGRCAVLDNRYCPYFFNVLNDKRGSQYKILSCSTGVSQCKKRETCSEIPYHYKLMTNKPLKTYSSSKDLERKSKLSCCYQIKSPTNNQVRIDFGTCTSRMEGCGKFNNDFTAKSDDIRLNKSYNKKIQSVSSDELVSQYKTCSTVASQCKRCEICSEMPYNYKIMINKPLKTYSSFNDLERKSKFSSSNPNKFPINTQASIDCGTCTSRIEGCGKCYNSFTGNVDYIRPNQSFSKKICNVSSDELVSQHKTCSTVASQCKKCEKCFEILCNSKPMTDKPSKSLSSSKGLERKSKLSCHNQIKSPLNTQISIDFGTCTSEIGRRGKYYDSFIGKENDILLNQNFNKKLPYESSDKLVSQYKTSSTVPSQYDTCSETPCNSKQMSDKPLKTYSSSKDLERKSKLSCGNQIKSSTNNQLRIDFGTCTSEMEGFGKYNNDFIEKVDDIRPNQSFIKKLCNVSSDERISQNKTRSTAHGQSETCSEIRYNSKQMTDKLLQSYSSSKGLEIESKFPSGNQINSPTNNQECIDFGTCTSGMEGCGKCNNGFIEKVDDIGPNQSFSKKVCNVSSDKVVSQNKTRSTVHSQCETCSKKLYNSKQMTDKPLKTYSSSKHLERKSKLSCGNQIKSPINSQECIDFGSCTSGMEGCGKCNNSFIAKIDDIRLNRSCNKKIPKVSKVAKKLEKDVNKEYVSDIDEYSLSSSCRSVKITSSQLLCDYNECKCELQTFGNLPLCIIKTNLQNPKLNKKSSRKSLKVIERCDKSIMFDNEIVCKSLFHNLPKENKCNSSNKMNQTCLESLIIRYDKSTDIPEVCGKYFKVEEIRQKKLKSPSENTFESKVTECYTKPHFHSNYIETENSYLLAEKKDQKEKSNEDNYKIVETSTYLLTCENFQNQSQNKHDKEILPKDDLEIIAKETSKDTSEDDLSSKKDINAEICQSDDVSQTISYNYIENSKENSKISSTEDTKQSFSSIIVESTSSLTDSPDSRIEQTTSEVLLKAKKPIMLETKALNELGIRATKDISLILEIPILFDFPRCEHQTTVGTQTLKDCGCPCSITESSPNSTMSCSSSEYPYCCTDSFSHCDFYEF